MKIDLDQKIKLLEPITVWDEQGEPIGKQEYFNDGNNGHLTLAQVTARALTNLPPEKGKEMAGDEKVRRFKLAVKLIDGGTQDISAKDIAMLQECVNAVYPNIAIVAQAHAMLEGES